MSRTLVVLIALLTFGRLADAAAPEVVLLRGGHVWTGDPQKPNAQAVLVENGHVSAVGSDAELDDLVKKRKLKPRVVALAGRQVLPGLIDSHVHIIGGGLQLDRVDLNPARSREETLQLIKRYAEQHPDRPWILGRGWSYDYWKPGLPTRAELDAIVPDRPVFVRAYDGHSGWANSKALQLAGIDEKTPDPKDGKIVRERDSKRPSGALLEEAMELMWAKVGKPSLEDRRQAILRAVDHAVARGLTGLCEVGGDLAELDAYASLDREGKLKARIVFGPSIDDGIDAYAERRKKLLADKRVGMLTPGPLKGFVDGVIESNTAHLLAPPADGTKAEPPHLSPEVLRQQIERADFLGLDVAYHAIGDASVRSVLDAVQEIEKRHGPSGRRPRIEHIEVVDPADVPRFAALGVIPSMMPLHAVPGTEPDGGVWAKKAGPKRLPHAFAFAELRRAGAMLAFGSDWPVVMIDPLPAIGSAVTRTRPDGVPKGGWVPEQGLSIDEALHGYTTRAAFATRLEQVTGALRSGLAADLIVLEPSGKLEDPASLFRSRVDLTMVAGKVVYERAGK